MKRKIKNFLKTFLTGIIVIPIFYIATSGVNNLTSYHSLLKLSNLNGVDILLLAPVGALSVIFIILLFEIIIRKETE